MIQNFALLVVWSLLAAMAVTAGAAAAPPAEKAPGWLHADGARIVDAQGTPVVLGGVNLGGWLVEEMWMMPFETKPPEGSDLPAIKDHVSLWQVVERRLGAEAARKVRTALRNAWITPADFDRIRAAKMNCVRLPFTFDLLEEPDGYAWIDRALGWARERGLHVILDLHGAPGRQSGADHTGQSDVDRLFKDPAMVQRTVEVWTALARRYRDHPEVAAYDLLNEPMGAPDAATLYIVQDRLIRAIRSVDPRHMIIVEDGYKGVDSFPRPAVAGWENVILSWHHYRFDAKNETEQASGLADVAATASRIAADRNAPILIGEFQIEPHGTPAALAGGLKAFQKGNHSWTIWTYKVALRDGTGGMWGWFRATPAPTALDPCRDSAETLLQKIELLRTERLQENREMTEAFRASR